MPKLLIVDYICLNLVIYLIWFDLTIIYMQGIPEAAEVAVPAAQYPSNPTETGGVTTGVVPGVPNSSPLNMFPQVKIIWMN